MRRASRLDRTHPGIVAALRAVGASVQSLAPVGGGCGDLLVGHQGHNYVIEAKSPGGKLTPLELAWIRDWRGQVAVVTDARGALAVLGIDAGKLEGSAEPSRLAKEV